MKEGDLVKFVGDANFYKGRIGVVCKLYSTHGISLSGLNDYKNVKIGSIDVTPDKAGAVGADHVPPMFERYLTGLRISGPGNIAIKRS